MKFREVKCPFCDHVFMWREYGEMEPEYRERNEDGTKGEYLYRTKCPKCEETLAIKDHVFLPLDPADKHIIGVPERR